MKTAVFYHFFDDGYLYRENFFFFMSRGYRAEVDFFITISGDTSVDLPTASNIRYIKTPNINLDFGALGIILSIVDLSDYEWAFFVNSTVRGPFVPSYFCESWLNPFIRICSQDFGIVGTSINVLSRNSRFYGYYNDLYPKESHDDLSHVQTMAYLMPTFLVKNLFSSGFFASDRKLTKDEVICAYELRLSRTVLDMGYNIGCLLPEFSKVDFRKPYIPPALSSFEGDVWFPGGYRGYGIHPYQSIFVKTNRGLFDENFLRTL